MQLLKHRQHIFHPPPRRVIYSYQRYQDIFSGHDDIEFVRGHDYELKKDQDTLLIIDDQLSSDLSRVERLFTVDAHHLGVSVMFVTQNLFLSSKAYRTISLNTQYFILFKSPRGVQQVSTLARQLYTGNKAKKMMKAYMNATLKPFHYLLVDLKPDTPEDMRFRTRVVPFHDDEDADLTFNDRTQICYQI